MSPIKTIREEILNIHITLAELRTMMAAHLDYHRQAQSTWGIIVRWGTLGVALVALLKGFL